MTSQKFGCAKIERKIIGMDIYLAGICFMPDKMELSVCACARVCVCVCVRERRKIELTV